MTESEAATGPRPRIAVQLLGGLGNQMFQAAAGLSLSERLGASLVFDLARFRTKGLRAFALTPFSIEAELKAEPLSLLQKGAQSLGLRQRHRPGWWGGAMFSEAQFGYDQAFGRVGVNTLLQGYFQSPRYFDRPERIAALFAPEKLASPAAKARSEALDTETSVAVHVRHGDYVSDARAAAVHPILPLSYYQRAVAHVQSHVPDARFFITSDDPVAARELAEGIPGAALFAGESAGDDLFLMSRCRHHIIANSSFSWWSAWLDQRKGGIRIAPRQWFTPEAMKARRTDDLIPADWLQI